MNLRNLLVGHCWHLELIDALFHGRLQICAKWGTGKHCFHAMDKGKSILQVVDGTGLKHHSVENVSGMDQQSVGTALHWAMLALDCAILEQLGHAKGHEFNANNLLTQLTMNPLERAKDELLGMGAECLEENFDAHWLIAHCGSIFRNT